MSADTVAGDFLSLLAARRIEPLRAESGTHAPPYTEGTTVFAFYCAEGVLVAGDRRATAGNWIVTDRIEKIIEVDDASLLAIAGAPAIAFEMARVLQTSFEYYRRSQLQPLSLAAKVRALARLLRENLPMTLQGVGVVMPLFAACDPKDPQGPPRIFFYDPLGAQFQAVDFAASGSGSGTIRSILDYQSRFGVPKPSALGRVEATVLALRLLAVAAAHDSATGGVQPGISHFATLRLLARGRIETITEAEQRAAWERAGIDKDPQFP